MNNTELERLLREGTVPERDAEYWERFPATVTQQLRRAEHRTVRKRPQLSSAALFWGLGLAAACLIGGFVAGFWNGRRTVTESGELVAMRTYFREVGALFPNQIRAIVIDEQGPRLVLSETTSVPPSPPLFVKICGPAGCKRFVTFSGQEIRVNGDVYEVLADGEGGIILLGANSVWASTQRSAAQGGYQIEARPLEMML